MTFQPSQPEPFAAERLRPGRISLVGAGPGAADLLTFRAVERMRQADVIFHDRLVEPEVLEMAGPGPRRVFVGKEVGAHDWPQERIDATITAAALSGLAVVRLKSGDPSVFGRACEEIAAARAFGIEVEIIPGITAASAAAAALCRPLTERGATDRLVLATATCRPGDRKPDLAALARPGTTVALYMAMHRLDEVADEFRAAGVPDDAEVLICAHVARPGQRSLVTTLARMARDARREGLGNPAVVFLRLPRHQAAPASAARRADAAAVPS
ncbi:uroporphyrinogen-III C-methyltransferase [Cereibacter sphaeroides]|uniref:uroporphyrinogen-III C-methyltransferase n=1 Tax=Rhodobacterales TaxID=204455 RepID=UPI000BBE3F67|nr:MULTISPECIES: uroporphyrinogen-III C-methyltransferase [Paracoccaceae]MCE6959202.1 uroporphyrinogen-III C-methyltransferase [Cereibacter sphaeroides]MCE6968444.1 uroporphyrinogen-III C-methyltransferase [Cereibacter sphaeroides]MCE6974137.1 uroporphyrinogen-III C-methyltransferase [Cereibacter sphaeroides]